VYERAISNIPPILEKRYWRRYVYLWISYAVFEELSASKVTVTDHPQDEGDGESGVGAGREVDRRARDVYRECLRVIPHKKFTFAKIWLNAAYLEVRARDLGAARKLLGTAIGLYTPLSHILDLLFISIFHVSLPLPPSLSRLTGLCPKEKLFKSYIELELQLGEVERCRTLYGKYLQFMPFNCTAWQAFSQLEINVGETNRAR
jgi:crooked neck